MFRGLFGGKKEADKRQAEQRHGRGGKYGRLAAWIKSYYGNNFRDGQTSDEVKTQLDMIFRELASNGSLSGDTQRGFRAFIESRQYGDLVKVRE